MSVTRRRIATIAIAGGVSLVAGTAGVIVGAAMIERPPDATIVEVVDPVVAASDTSVVDETSSSTTAEAKLPVTVPPSWTSDQQTPVTVPPTTSPVVASPPSTKTQCSDYHEGCGETTTSSSSTTTRPPWNPTPTFPSTTTTRW